MKYEGRGTKDEFELCRPVGGGRNKERPAGRTAGRSKSFQLWVGLRFEVLQTFCYQQAVCGGAVDGLFNRKGKVACVVSVVKLTLFLAVFLLGIART